MSSLNDTLVFIAKYPPCLYPTHTHTRQVPNIAKHTAYRVCVPRVPAVDRTKKDKYGGGQDKAETDSEVGRTMRRQIRQWAGQRIGRSGS